MVTLSAIQMMELSSLISMMPHDTIIIRDSEYCEVVDGEIVSTFQWDELNQNWTLVEYIKH